MAGEVHSELTIRLTGGVGGGPAAVGTSRPVSMRSDLVSPGQAMSSFAGGRRSLFTQQIAMEMARDKQAAAEIHAALERADVMRSLDVSSARRASRENFAQIVRQSRGSGGEAGMLGGVGSRVERQLKTQGKRLFKSGIKAGIGAAAADFLPDLLPDSPGSRIATSTATGAAYGAAIGSMAGGVGAGPGAAAGAIIGAIQQTMSEMKNYVKDLYEMGQKLKEQSDDNLAEARKHLKEMQGIVAGLKVELEDGIAEAKTEIGREMARDFYRTSRYVHATLNGD